MTGLIFEGVGCHVSPSVRQSTPAESVTGQYLGQTPIFMCQNKLDKKMDEQNYTLGSRRGSLWPEVPAKSNDQLTIVLFSTFVLL